MKVSQWAEIRRLAEVEKLSRRGIARRLGCCQRTVARALRLNQPPDEKRALREMKCACRHSDYPMRANLAR